jgi:cellulose synthase/poly-beta-1,6-N-acetylglucosamine synthase-like glycosyltransferase
MAHFRTAALVSAGAWDAWNVTEDADLGLRLARLGYRVGTLASRTAEEAPPTLRAIFRQRTRWMKGWMQTLGVHLRDPAALVRDLGPLRSMAVIATFAAGIAGPMIWPLVMGILVHDAVAGSLLAPIGIVQAIASTLCLGLAAVGIVTMLTPMVIGARRLGIGSSLWFLPLLPLWHVLLFVAGWRALFDLFRDPFGWAKTDHGHAKKRDVIAKL